MSKKMKSKSWPEIGTLRKQNGKNPYLVLHPNVKILVGKYNSETKKVEDYEELNLGSYRTVQCIDPKVGIDALLEGDYINEEEHTTRLEHIESKNIRYKLTIPPSEE